MIKKILIILGIIAGSVFFIILLLAFTSAPFYMHYSLGTDPNRTKDVFEPDYVLMLGGAGMPSQSNLMRLFYAAEFANKFQTPVFVLHPKDSLCQEYMKRELVLKGVEHEKIIFFTEGSNTRSQVLQIKEKMPELSEKKLLVITSPEHLTRTVKCFNKVGFTNVRGQGAFEATVDFDLSLKDKKLEGNEFVPNVENTNMRYTFWNYLKLEIDCYREYVALTYYKLKGWI